MSQVHDPTAVDATEKAESAGGIERAAFHVAELDCAEEVLLLRQELEGAPGIRELDFDVLRSRMTVGFEPGRTSAETIIRRVARAGMRAEPWDEHTPAEQTKSPAWGSARLLGTILAGVLLGAGFISHALSTGSLAQAFGFGAEELTFPLLSRVLYALSIAAGICLVLPKAWAALRTLRADMNLLMTLAVIGAVGLGQWLEGATVAFLFSLALLLEQWSLGRARRAIAALLDLAPATARCVCAGHDDRHAKEHVVEKHVEQVEVGETVVVRPGERIPLDGVVQSGTTAVDESAITGESIPVAKRPGDEVFAGTINQQGAIRFEVTRPATDTTLARILHMVEEAQSRRAPTEQWVERFARYYTPAMLALAVGVALGPPLLFAASWTDWAYNALVLLVIACPCALVISTPVSIVSALTAATRHGVLVKGGRYLEAAAHVAAVAVDKTGTLTLGEPVVQQVVPLNGHTERELLERAAAMEAHSQHPLARAILDYTRSQSIPVATAEKHRLLEGLGAEGIFGGKEFWIGSHRLVRERAGGGEASSSQAAELEDAGYTVVAVGNARHVCGLIALADQMRPDVFQTVRRLKQLQVRHVELLTGDNEQTARQVAHAAGVDAFRAELLPQDKVREVERLREEYRWVAMVGDGVNDAPALAASTLGVAMGARGVDAAIETADVALMSDDLSRLPWLIAHARRTLRVIRQNVAFALGLKALFVVLTLVGVASLWLAIAADTGASLLVIFNGLRLLKG